MQPDDFIHRATAIEEPQRSKPSDPCRGMLWALFLSIGLWILLGLAVWEWII